MNLRAAGLILIMLVFSCSVGAQPEADRELFSAARPVVPTEYSDSNLRIALKNGLRHPEGTAVAVVIPFAKASLLLIALKRSDGRFLVADVSSVESGNFGKLGRPRTDYERYETQPVKWLQRDDGLFQVVMRTRAWRMGQRYTVAEPLVIKHDGTVLHR
jgi:hypothetical protein